MISGKLVRLRPIRDDDWATIEAWGQDRDGLWGPFQRFQMDHLPKLREAYQHTGLLKRDGGFLLVEELVEPRPVGFVRYTMLSFPDADLPYPEIGCGIPDVQARRKGLAKEAVALLTGYLFSGYPLERVAAFTDVENLPAQHVLEAAGFRREGVLARSTFRDRR